MQGVSLRTTVQEQLSTLGKRLKRARKVAGFASQEALADAIGLSRRETLAEWETDAAKPELENAQLLADALGVSLDWLVSGPRLYDLADGSRITRADPGPSTHPEAAAVTTRGGPPAPPPSRGSTSRKPRRGESPEATP